MKQQRAVLSLVPQNDDIRLETVGPALEGTEVKITDQGELVYRHARYVPWLL